MHITRNLGIALKVLLGMAMTGTSLNQASAADTTRVYFGTYTGRASKGIYVSTLDLKTGRLTDPVLAAESQNPAYLAIHPNRKFIYSVAEMNAGGGVTAWAVNPADGTLRRINHESTGGAGPTHLVVDRAGKNVLAANYGGGSVACLPIQPDGSVRKVSSFVQHTGSSVDPNRQKEPHAHGIYTDPSNRFAVAPDLGLDHVKIYRFDADHGTLTPNDPAFGRVSPGAGPRHFAFDPKGRFGYVINEMVCTMTAFSWDSKAGVLKEIQTLSTLPPGLNVQPGMSTAEVFVHPGGRFLYGSNRGHDTIVVYSIDKAGRLTWVENVPALVKVPRGFGIDPSGRYLITGGQNSDTAAVFRIDATTGRLTPTGQVVSVGSPVCVEFLTGK